MVKFSENKDAIFAAVNEMYTDVATSPARQFHFPTGRPACLFVGYPAEQLDAVPESAVESFAGVGYPFAGGAIKSGTHVLDIGSGSGTDALIAATLAGSGGKVYGLDMTPAMLEKSGVNAKKMGVPNVEFIPGNAEKIPLPDEAVDVVTSNGVLNLVPDKPKAFREIFRVLRPGGRFQIADIVLGRPIKESSRQNPDLWAECIVGAVLEKDYIEMFRDAGFEDVRVIGRVDYFSKSPEEETREVAASYGAETIVITGTRPVN